jgi:hypothetical protein
MRRRVGNTDFGFPSDLGKVAGHHGAGRKSGHIGQPGGRNNSINSLWRLPSDGAVAGYGFDQLQPVPLNAVYRLIGHLAVFPRHVDAPNCFLNHWLPLEKSTSLNHCPFLRRQLIMVI